MGQTIETKEIYEGERRINHPHDWVCKEIELGFKAKKIFPIYMGGAKIGSVNPIAMPKTKPYLRSFFEEVQGFCISESQKKHEFEPIFQIIEGEGIKREKIGKSDGDSKLPPIIIDEPSKKFKLGDQHIYTCDRVKHQDKFNKSYNLLGDRYIQYYYLYGQEIQSHSGFFKRISYWQKGILDDSLNTNIKPTCKVIEKEIPFRSGVDLEGSQINIIKSIFTTFGLQPNIEAPLLQKKIGDVLNKSQQVQGLTNKDYIFLLLRINEYDWDRNITPNLVKWLIASFFENSLETHHPKVLVFFGLIYNEDNSEIEKEVLEVLEEIKKKEEEQSLKILPELKNVEEKCIKQWFTHYSQIFKSTVSIKKIRQDYFKSEEDFNMENIEIKLKKILDQYNKNKGPL